MAYGWSNAFGKSSEQCWVRGHNNTRDLNVDVKTRAQLLGRGLCSGITSTWVVGFLSPRVSEARDVLQFSSYFHNVLRFQGAYFKETHGRIGDHMGRLISCGFNPGIRHIKTEEINVVSPGILPDGTWAAYASIWGHAVGIGFDGENYYQMDPNYGLFEYDNMSSFLLDFQNLIEARRSSKNKKLEDTVKLFFYESV